MEGDGGALVVEILSRWGIDKLMTLSGGHLFPIYDACVKHDKALRGRVKLLGHLLGDVINSQAGDDVLRTVERLRKGFLGLREDYSADRLQRLKNLIAKLSPDALRPVIRAFSIYFQLVNNAEESFQHRQRRQIAARGGVLWKGSFDACLRDLRDRGIDPDELQDLFEEIRYMPVFTAHPTESKRRSIMLQIRRIFESNEALDSPPTSVDHKERHVRALRTHIQTLWKTDEVRPSRPDARHEIRMGLYHFKEALFDVGHVGGAPWDEHLGKPVFFFPGANSNFPKTS